MASPQIQGHNNDFGKCCWNDRQHESMEQQDYCLQLFSVHTGILLKTEN